MGLNGPRPDCSARTTRVRETRVKQLSPSTYQICLSCTHQVWVTAHDNMNNKDFLKLAVEQAKKSVEQGGFPAGAVMEKGGKVISEGVSLGFSLHDPTEHAETSAIRKACQKLQTTNLEGAVLYASLQPCLMCFSVANWAGISKIVYGCRKTEKMAKKNYYEGVNEVEEINKKNNRQIEIEFIPDYEQEMLELVKNWEKKQK